MKKALVLLLILAVAGGIFAQDLALSVGGEVRFGADIDFMPADATATMLPEQNQTFEDFDNHGKANLNLDKPGAHFGLGFTASFAGGEDANVIATGTFGDDVNGEETFYKLNAGIKFIDGSGALGVDSLYGYWLFLDRQLKVDLAYKGYETIYWRVSDVVASDWDNLDGNGGLEISFMPNAVAGLNAGIFFPGQGSGALGEQTPRDGAFPSEGGGQFLNDWFKTLVIGAKYENDMFGASVMFNAGAERALDDTSVNAGFKFTGIANILIAADVQLDRLDKIDEKYGGMGLAFGVKFEYAAAPLTAGVVFKITDYSTEKPNPALFTLQPYIYYDVIADTLQARLIPTIMIGLADRENYKIADIEADLFWNMNRDGTGDDPAMGLLVKYVMGLDLDGEGRSIRAVTLTDRNVTEGGLYKSELGLYFRWAF